MPCFDVATEIGVLQVRRDVGDAIPIAAVPPSNGYAADTATDADDLIVTGRAGHGAPAVEFDAPFPSGVTAKFPGCVIDFLPEGLSAVLLAGLMTPRQRRK